MMRKPKVISRFHRILQTLFFSFFALTVTLSIASLLVETPRAVRGVNLGALFSMGIVLITGAWSSLPRHGNLSRPAPNPASNRRGLPLIFCLFGIFIFGRAVVEMKTPLDWDELDTATRLVSPELCPVDETKIYQNADVISPTTNTRNHTVANLASLAAMKLFGINEWNARLPALFFTALFLLALFYFAGPTLTTWSAFLILGHFAANGMLQWYFHSMRGYASTILFAATAFFILVQLEMRKPQAGDRYWIFIAIALATLSHTFGSIFALILILSRFNWTGFRFAEFSSQDKKRQLRFALFLFIPVPIMLFILFKQFFFLSRIGFLFAPTNTANEETLLSVLGIVSSQGTFILGALFAGILYAKYRFDRRIDFTTVFTLSAVILLAFLIRSTQATLFEGRFLLPFVAPLVFWVAKTIEAVPRRSLKLALGGLAAYGLLILPALGNHALFKLRSDLMSDYANFMTRVKTATGKTDPGCFAFSGAAEAVRFSQGLYFRSPNRPANCPVKYRVHFFTDWQGEHPLLGNESAELKLVSEDHHGRALYQIGQTASVTQDIGRK